MPQSQEQIKNYRKARKAVAATAMQTGNEVPVRITCRGGELIGQATIAAVVPGMEAVEVGPRIQV